MFKKINTITYIYFEFINKHYLDINHLIKYINKYINKN